MPEDQRDTQRINEASYSPGIQDFAEFVEKRMKGYLYLDTTADGTIYCKVEEE